jgi:hypothetical protein
MKCLYFLAPTLADTHDIADDLHEVGVKDFFLHVISRDEAGLKKQHVHSSNYLETLDLVRSGVIGGAIGCAVGILGVYLLRQYNPIGVAIPNLVSFLLIGVATLFGTWEGGLVGVATENRKLTRFHDDIESGKFLLLIYAFKEQEQRVLEMMRARHPEAKLAGVDRHFVNPFSSPRRDAAGSQDQAAGKA